MNIFIDTSGKYLTIILEKKEIIIDSIFMNGEKKHTEQTVESINDIFKKNNISWKDITSIYSTSGPGSYTGTRVSLTIAKTIKILNPKIKIYLINSLLYCLGKKDGKVAIPLSNTKYYYAEYKDYKLKNDIELININKINLIGATLMNDNFNYVKNFLELKNKFIEHKNFINYKIS